MTPAWTTIASSLVAAIVGGCLVHFLAARRDARTLARQHRVELLIRAYRTMVAANSHGGMTKARADGLTVAFNDLMLLGNLEQVNLCLAEIKRRESKS